MKELTSSKQGTNTPSEFAELTKTCLKMTKTLLKIHPNLGGYTTDSASAVNILVGNELLKKKESNFRKSATVQAMEIPQKPSFSLA